MWNREVWPWTSTDLSQTYALQINSLYLTFVQSYLKIPPSRVQRILNGHEKQSYNVKLWTMTLTLNQLFFSSVTKCIWLNSYGTYKYCTSCQMLNIGYKLKKYTYYFDLTFLNRSIVPKTLQTILKSFIFCYRIIDILRA